VSGQLHAYAALPPAKIPRDPMDSRLGEPQSLSGCCEHKNLALPGIEPWAFSPSLYRLSYLDSCAYLCSFNYFLPHSNFIFIRFYPRRESVLKITVFLIVCTTCILVDTYGRFGGTCCLHLQSTNHLSPVDYYFTAKMEAIRSSGTSANIYQTIWVTSQKNFLLQISLPSNVFSETLVI
jgi:hypothetical protein